MTSFAWATETFTNAHGSAPEGIWSAPGRVNLIGEHTDYNGGFVLPFAINRRTWVAAGKRGDTVLSAQTSFADDAVTIDLAQLEPGAMSGWAAYVFGVAWALREQAGADSALPGVSLVIDSDVPVGAGLSSSAAIECAVASALNDLWSLGLSAEDLAKVGQRAENLAVGAPTGIMDQSASMLGRRDHAVFLDCESLVAQTIPLGFDAANLDLLVIDTKVSHSHASGGYASRRAACERGAASLNTQTLRQVTAEDLPRAEELLDDETFRRVRHVVTENARVLRTVELLSQGKVDQIQDLLLESHQSMRDDFEISCPELDQAVESAMNAGALGARMTGGGFGGAAIALLRRDQTDAAIERVQADFMARGFAQPDCFVVTADDGARRES